MEDERARVWRSWAAGELSDAEAQAAAEAIERRARGKVAPEGGSAPAPAARARRGDLPRHLRPAREKVFGPGRRVPLDRNAKVRIMTRARALMRRTEAGKHYGAITAKALAVLEALLWGFHNAHTGACFPAYEAIADRAGCARSTVYEAIGALEAAGLLTWTNRIVRVRDHVRDLFGRMATRWRVVRTSNAYRFIDPISSRSERPTRTSAQESTSLQGNGVATPKRGFRGEYGAAPSHRNKHWWASPGPAVVT